MLLFLLIWALCGSNPDLGHPWSGWFIALFVIAVLQFLGSNQTKS
jgi:hypothetical protein